MIKIPLTIKETQKGLLTKTFSAVELVNAYLERINQYDQKLNAFITVSDKIAYQQAKRIDKIIRDKDLSAQAGLSAQTGLKVLNEYPLLGVTVAHKDLFLTKGVRTTAASKVLESYVPAYSATVVERLEKAGCILIGKTNCDAWAHGSSGENSDFGPSKNPWNLDFVPGGSSSGSGAALAANFSLITTGTDTCGSIRLPANYCYSFGLKPTYGSVSRYGVVAMASSLDSIGHLARSSEDCEKVYNIICGPDGKDSTLKKSPKPQVSGRKLRLKIGLPREFLIEGLEKEVKQTVLKSAKIFEKEGLDVVEISLPLMKYAIGVYYIIQPAEVSSNLARYDGIRFGKDRTAFSDEAKRRIMLGTYVLSAGYYDAYYIKAMKVRSKIIAEINQAFETVDAILAPVAPTPPFKLGEKINDPLKMYLTDIFAATANLSGIPSLAVPFGFSQKGLPLGFQLMAPKFFESTLFQLGKLFEKATNYQPKVAI